MLRIGQTLLQTFTKIISYLNILQNYFQKINMYKKSLEFQNQYFSLH